MWNSWSQAEVKTSYLPISASLRETSSSGSHQTFLPLRQGWFLKVGITYMSQLPAKSPSVGMLLSPSPALASQAATSPTAASMLARKTEAAAFSPPKARDAYNKVHEGFIFSRPQSSWQKQSLIKYVKKHQDHTAASCPSEGWATGEPAAPSCRFSWPSHHRSMAKQQLYPRKT